MILFRAAQPLELAVRSRCFQCRCAGLIGPVHVGKLLFVPVSGSGTLLYFVRDEIPMNIALRSAVDQLKLLRNNDISPIELAEEHIRRIERLNPVLNAIVDFDAVLPVRVAPVTSVPNLQKVVACH